MHLKRLDGKSDYAVEVTLPVIGGIWRPAILFHPLPRKKRSMELTRLIPNVTQHMLALQLRELRVDGVITRRVYSQVSSKAEHVLTPLGEPLVPVLVGPREWGESYHTNEMSRKPATPPQRVRAEAMTT